MGKGLNSYVTKHYVKCKKGKGKKARMRQPARTGQRPKPAAKATRTDEEKALLDSFRQSQKTFNRCIKVRSEGTLNLPMTAESYFNIINCIGFESVKNSRVLEIGCGSGTFVQHLIDSDAQLVIGTDFVIKVPEQLGLNEKALFLDHDCMDLEGIPEGITIIIAIIASDDVNYLLLDLFSENVHVKDLIILMPAEAEYKNPINDYIADTFDAKDFPTQDIPVEVSGGGTKRWCKSIKRK